MSERTAKIARRAGMEAGVKAAWANLNQMLLFLTQQPWRIRLRIAWMIARGKA